MQEVVIGHFKDQGRSVLEIRGETNTSDAGVYSATAINKAGKAESVGEIQIYSKYHISFIYRQLPFNLHPSLH